MKRSLPIFSQIGNSEFTNECGTPNCGTSSMTEKSNVNRGSFSNQNAIDSPIHLSSGGEGFIIHQPQIPISRGGTLIRSQSIPSLKCGNEDLQGGTKLSLGRSVGPGDQTPVTHLCTSRQSGSGQIPSGDHSKTKLLSQKRLSDQHHGTRLKRFFSEANLQKVSATPDCFSKVHMETPRNKVESEDLPVFPSDETSHLTVGVRVRPFNMREQNDIAVVNVVSVDGSKIKMMSESGTTYTFIYDYCFWSCDPEHPQFASQDVIFNTLVQPLIDKAFQGYNACLFAYGQTGSGKSYSMMGLDIDIGNSIGNEVGIIPRFCYELFERIASLEDSDSSTRKSTCNVEISYFEIYNEKIHDLLGGSSDGKRAPLKVREHPVFGPYVVDLSVLGVASYEDVQGWLTVGNSQRATAATGMNEKSSRSHSIFNIILTQTEEEPAERGEFHKHCRRSKINLVDLAGSERLSHTCTSGDRLKEGVSINGSLLSLGKVIAALADNANGKKKNFVPYRDSILTWLLRESLGGNSRTTMLATISPANIHLDETLATLRYAGQARTIVNRVRVNEDPHDRLIRELRAEVNHLRALREDYEHQMKMGVPRRLLQPDRTDLNDKEREIEILKEQLKHKEEQLRQSEELTKAQKPWTERLEEAVKQKSAELNHLRRCGVALQLDWKQHSPCLVNLAADPSFSGTLYLLPEGVIRIGRLGATTGDQQPDIALSGPLIQPHHCTVENKDSKLTLIPGSKGETFVNGELAKERIGLQHGDRLVIGGNHYFRVSNSYENDTAATGQPVDYEYAHQEILRIQEERLHADLDEAKRQAVQELEAAKKEAEWQLGFQRMNYEQQLKQIGTALEEQKNALSEIQKKKDELEIQKNMLEAEVQRRSAIQETTTDFIVTPYRSNFLQEIEAALNETVVDTESNLKMEMSLSDSLDGTHLHELIVAVEEANQRCKEMDIHFEFQHQYIFGESGLEPKVRVRDTDKHLTAFWKPTNFLKWLSLLRDYEPNDSFKELLDTDLSWEADDWKGNEHDSMHNRSRISVNMHQIKQQLNDSIQHLSVEYSSNNDSVLGSSQNYLSVTDNTSTADCTRDTEGVSNCLQQMETAAIRLHKLCKNRKKCEKVCTTLDSLHGLIQQLRFVLDVSHEHDISFTQQYNTSEHSPQLFGSSPKKRYFPCLPSHSAPVRSSLRSPCPQLSRTKKAVRFFLTTSQQERNTE